MKVEWVPLGEVLRLERTPVDLVAGESYRRIGIFSWGKGMLRREPASLAEMGSMRYFRFPIPSLVFSNIQAWEGAVALAGDEDADFVCSSRFYPYIPREGADVNLGFLLEFFRSEEGLALMRRASPGTQVRNKVLSRTALEAARVPLPPRPDQDRIAAHLGRLAVGVQAASRTSPSSLPSPEMAWLEMVFNHAWPLIPLGRVFEISRGSVLRQDPDGREVALGQASVRWGFLDHSLAKLLDDEWANRQPPSRRVVQGDLLLNSTGEGTLGRAAIVRERDAGMLHDSKVLRLRPSREVLSEFTAMFLRSPQGRNAVSSVKGANTTKQTELGIQRTVGLSAPLPSIDVQRRVIAAWRRIDPLFGEADGLRRKREVLVGSVLPAARNEIFSAMR